VFAPLGLSQVAGVYSDGSIADKPLGLNGRVAIIAGQPLLEALIAPDLTRDLGLYGLPGTNYTLQYTTRLGPGFNWSPLLSVTLTNSFQLLDNVGTTNGAIFYRLLSQ
jgi:hypothetical protein